MVVELLEDQGLRVFTNRTGSNFTRGVAAALLGEVDIHGKLNADIAVLELDEAYAVHFVRAIAPSYCLLLNVMRDQLDRFGEIDSTAKLLHTIARTTTRGIVLNHDDPRLNTTALLDAVSAPVHTYSVAPSLLKLFPTDDSLHGQTNKSRKESTQPTDDTRLVSIKANRAVFHYDNRDHEVSLQLKGMYNIQNAAGAIAMVRMVMGDKLDSEQMLVSLGNVTPAFGRGESLVLNGQPCEIVLVKNPSGFRLSLKSFPPAGYATMIAINDQYADGRDMSWLWDVDFDSLRDMHVAMVSGIRAYDMALRLQYDEVEMAHVQPDLTAALQQFISSNHGTPLRIYCTYTAMLAIRKQLAKLTDVEVVR
jgi:UDP-N-acetylmuramyl tripeptide synthase